MTAPPIKSWSFSRLADFEICAYRAKLKVVDKVPEPERPLKPGQTEHANDRGTRIHDATEMFIRDKGSFPIEAEKFRPAIESLKNRFAKAGDVSLEGEWGFNKEWEVCDYKKAWLRVKLDASILLSPKHLLVVDYKTGRKFGNEIKHGEQTMLYGACAAIRNPKVEIIDTELWYFDQKPGENITGDSKPVSKWLYHIKAFNNRGRKMTEATEFKPNPSQYACQYCAYKDGICKFAHLGDKPVRRKGQ